MHWSREKFLGLCRSIGSAVSALSSGPRVILHLWQTYCGYCGRKWRWLGKSAQCCFPLACDTWRHTSSSEPRGLGPGILPPLGLQWSSTHNPAKRAEAQNGKNLPSTEHTRSPIQSTKTTISEMKVQPGLIKDWSCPDGHAISIDTCFVRHGATLAGFLSPHYQYLAHCNQKWLVLSSLKNF